MKIYIVFFSCIMTIVSIQLKAAAEIMAAEEYTSELFHDIKLHRQGQLPVASIIKRINDVLPLLPEQENSIQALKITDPHSRIYVIGDIHADINEFIAQIQNMRDLNCFKSANSIKLQNNCYLVFTGDFADRGLRGIEVFLLAMGLKKLNPTHVFMSRGNHETAQIANSWGFFDNADNPAVKRCWPISEFQLRFPIPADRDNLKAYFSELFSRLPLAVFLGLENPINKKTIFGMFNHATYDPIATLATRTLLTQAIENPGIVQTRHSGILFRGAATLNAPSNFVWGDYTKGEYASARKTCTQGRMPGVTLCTKKAFTNDMAKLELGQHDFALAFQARGHQHTDGGILKLNKNNKDYKNETGFEPQRDPIIIDEKEIFMFMCLSGKRWAQFNYYGLGEFTMNNQGKWVLTPRILDTAERDKKLDDAIVIGIIDSKYTDEEGLPNCL